MSDEMLKLADEIDAAIAVTIRKRDEAGKVVQESVMARHRDLIVSALRAAATSAKSVSCNEKVSIDRSWLEHVVLVLQGELPSGRIGDVVFLLRDQLRDILDRPCPAPDAEIVAAQKEDVSKAVRFVLKDGKWPVYRTQDDSGLEEPEYVDFVIDVIAALTKAKGGSSDVDSVTPEELEALISDKSACRAADALVETFEIRRRK